MRQALILHLDMDAFYAAVEQRDQPELKGKPVIIGPDPTKGQTRGVVSTCSYEARVYGVHSAMPIMEAYRRCPQGIYISGNMARYKEVSEHLFEIISRYTPTYEPLSLDEAFIDAHGMNWLYESERAFAESIQTSVYDELGLTCSIGVSSKKFIAKIASDFKKPNGITIVEDTDELSFLAALPVDRFWGVGDVTLRKLNSMGIRTGADLQAMSHDHLHRAFGSMGDHLYRLAHAIDERNVSRGHSRKSISKERTFSTDQANHDIVRRMIYTLTEDLLIEIATKNFHPSTLQLKVRYSDFKTLTRQVPLESPDLVLDRCFRTLIALFDNEVDSNRAIRLIGVGFANPVADSQLNVDLGEVKEQQITQLKANIRRKFGKGRIFGAEGLE